MKQKKYPNKKQKKKEYSELVKEIDKILELGRKRAFHAVNSILVKTYWEIGKRIVKYEQVNVNNTKYGSKLFERIAKDLRNKYGKGFSRSNIIYMRLFYLKYQKSQTPSDQLAWSHYVELLKLSDDIKRGFYEKQCIYERWSIRELKRQINSALFHRLSAGKDKRTILKLSKQGHLIEKAEDIIKDPYILEFLSIPENTKYSEKEFEQKIINNLQAFLLELGKGFTFVKRQHRITLDNTNYYVDLVFYNRLLNCFVLLDLKIGKVKHTDIGQMNLYLNYFKKEENCNTDNEPIGIILGANKGKIVIEYAIGGISNNLFVSQYKLYLPKKKELQEELRRIQRKA